MELIVVIGFFSLVAVICVRLFASASTSSKQSVNINHAIRTEESVIEVWLACDGDLSRIQKDYYPEADITSASGTPADGTLTLLMDENWQPLRPSGGDGSTYVLTLDSCVRPAGDCYGPDAEGEAIVATISTTDLSDGSTLSTLETDHYIRGGAAR